MYGFGISSPYNAKGKKQSQGSALDSDSRSEKSAKSDRSQSLQVYREEEDLIAECHIGFDKLLSSLFKFRDRTNNNLIK